MPFRRVPIRLALVCLLAAGLSSCLARRRLIARKGASITQPLLTADRQTLLDSITRQFEAVRDFNAEVDMVPALGTAEKSKITEYKDVPRLYPVPPAGGHPPHRSLPRGTHQGLRHGLQRPRFQAIRAVPQSLPDRQERDRRTLAEQAREPPPPALSGRHAGAAGRLEN